MSKFITMNEIEEPLKLSRPDRYYAGNWNDFRQRLGSLADSVEDAVIILPARSQIGPFRQYMVIKAGLSSGIWKARKSWSCRGGPTFMRVTAWPKSLYRSGS